MIVKKKKKKALKRPDVGVKKKAKIHHHGSDSCMYAKVTRTELLKIVELVAQALPSRELDDAKSGIFIETAYHTGDIPRLNMTVNSLDVFISHSIDLQDDVVTGYVVPRGKDFKNIIKGLQHFDDAIEISLNETSNEFCIECGENYKGTVHHYDSSNFVFPPILDDVLKSDTIALPAKFIKEAVKKVSFACSSDMTIPELTGVLIEQKEDCINIVGSDGNRIAYLSIKAKVKNPKRVIVGAKRLVMFYGILTELDIKSNEIVNLYISDDKLFFVVNNTYIGMQVFTGEYPIGGGYEQFLVNNDECEVELKINKKQFIEKMDLAVLHNSSNTDAIAMVVGDVCKLSNSDMSDNKFSIEFDVENKRNDIGSDVEILFTPVYLYDVLKNLKVSDFILLLKAEKVAIVKPCDETVGEYQYIFSLN